MKKIVFLICLCAVLSAMAEVTEPPCNGGTPITSHAPTDAGCSDETCNGHTFCRSDKDMNWWSAFTWCESQGRTLAEFSKMCPGVSQAPVGTTGDCPNLQGKGGNVWVWSSLAYGPDRAIVVTLSSGAVNSGSRNHASYVYALCE